MGPDQYPQYTVLPKGRRLLVAQSTSQLITGIHLCTALDQSPNINMERSGCREQGCLALWFNSSTFPQVCSQDAQRVRLCVCVCLHQETWSKVRRSRSIHRQSDGQPSRATLVPFPLAVQTVLKTVKIPPEQFLESLEKVVDMLSGVHHQMPEDPKVLKIAGVPQVQLIDKVADVSA